MPTSPVAYVLFGTYALNLETVTLPSSLQSIMFLHCLQREVGGDDAHVRPAEHSVLHCLQ